MTFDAQQHEFERGLSEIFSSVAPEFCCVIYKAIESFSRQLRSVLIGRVLRRESSFSFWPHLPYWPFDSQEINALDCSTPYYRNGGKPPSQMGFLLCGLSTKLGAQMREVVFPLSTASSFRSRVYLSSLSTSSNSIPCLKWECRIHFCQSFSRILRKSEFLALAFCLPFSFPMKSFCISSKCGAVLDVLKSMNARILGTYIPGALCHSTYTNAISLPKGGQ